MRKLFFVLICCTGVVMLLLIDQYYFSHWHAQKTLELEAATHLCKTQLEKSLDARLNALKSLEALMVLHPETSSDEFARFASTLLSFHPPMRAIQYADASTRVKYVYPPKNNEIAIKNPVQLISDPKRGPFVKKAIRLKKPVIQGPFELRQGGLGVVVRFPIFKDDAFSGLAIGVFDTSALVEDALSGIDLSRFEFQIKNADGVVFQKGAQLSGNAKTMSISIADARWSLSLAWKSSAASPPYLSRAMIWLCGISLIISILVLLIKTGRNQAMLLSDRNFIEKMLQITPIGIVRVNAGGAIVFANKQAEAILGIKLSSKQTRSYNDPTWKITDFNGGPFPNEALPFYIVKKTGKPVSNVHHAIEWPDGRRILLSINASPLMNKSGNFSGVVTSVEDITEKYRAEQNYQMIFNEMIDGFALHEIICDEGGVPVDYRFLAVNPAFERLTNLKKEAIIGKTALEVLPGIERYWIDKYGHVALTGEPVFFENYSRSLNRHYQVTAFQPAPNQFACIFVDITKRRHAEEALRLSEEKFQKAFLNAPLLMTISSLEDGRYIEVNNAFLKTTGYDRNHVVGNTSTAIGFISTKDRKKITERLSSEGRVSEMELELTRVDGIKLTCLYSGEIIKVEGKECLLSIAIDITQRKINEKMLWETTKRFQTVFESQLDAIMVLNAETPAKIIEANHAVSTMFQYDFREIIGKSVDIFHVDPFHLNRFQNELHIALKTDGVLKTFEFVMKRKDGTIFPSEHAVFELKDPAGQRSGWVSIIRDLTEQKQFAERLKQVQKMESIGNLAGGIAHDFNNILFPIIGMSEMLLEDLPDGSPDHEKVEEILRAGKRGGDLVKQILTFSRQTEHRLVPVKVQKILKEVLKLSRSTIPSDIEIDHNIQNDCGPVNADPTHMHQIAMNLITNAYHAVESAGGKIAVELKEVSLGQDAKFNRALPAGRYAMLTVSDTGCGISPEVRDRIFDPYFTTKQQGKGTGLGLAVVFGIVKESGGDIQVDSKPGNGATFTIYLPLIAKPEEAPIIQNTDALPRGKERVLLIDDEEMVAKIEKQILNRLGYHVTFCVSSVAALKLFKTDPFLFDIIVTDMTMPQITGDQLAREIIAIRPEIPIVICTGFSERIDREKADALGIKGFLMKPIVKSEMARMLRDILDGTTNGSRA